MQYKYLETVVRTPDTYAYRALLVPTGLILQCHKVATALRHGWSVIPVETLRTQEEWSLKEIHDLTYATDPDTWPAAISYPSIRESNGDYTYTHESGSLSFGIQIHWSPLQPESYSVVIEQRMYVARPIEEDTQNCFFTRVSGLLDYDAPEILTKGHQRMLAASHRCHFVVDVATDKPQNVRFHLPPASHHSKADEWGWAPTVDFDGEVVELRQRAAWCRTGMFGYTDLLSAFGIEKPFFTHQEMVHQGFWPGWSWHSSFVPLVLPDGYRYSPNDYSQLIHSVEAECVCSVNAIDWLPGDGLVCYEVWVGDEKMGSKYQNPDEMLWFLAEKE